MGAADLFTKEHWRVVGQGLKGVGAQWWEDHREELLALAQEEAREIFTYMKRGDLVSAKMEIVGRMSPEDWRAYRNGTTAALRGIAVQRAKLLEALEELGISIARLVGEHALRVL